LKNKQLIPLLMIFEVTPAPSPYLPDNCYSWLHSR